MELKELVTSLEISQQMKEAGIVQSSEFYWVRKIKDGEFVLQDHYIDRIIPCEVYSAFTAGELGEMLPESFTNDEGIEFSLEFWKRDLGSDDKWHIAYWWDEDAIRKSDFYIIKCDAETLADAMAKMLLHLKKEGLIGKEKI